jgi:PAS domain S-box-containing protein
MEAFTDRLPYMLALSFLTAFIVSVLIGAILVTNVLARIRFIKYKIRELGQGNLPEQIPATKDELNSIISAINDLTGNLRQIQDFAGYVGKGDFKSTIKVFNDQGDLGISLAIMRDELSKVAEEDRKRNWTNEGLTKFSDILRIHGNELNKLAEHIISQLVKYLKANQGGFFIVNDTNPDDPYLELRACYAYDRKKFTQKQIMPGQGLVGQVWRERQTVYLKEVPDDYLQITSGLGDATPRFLLIVPLINDNVIAGVLEVASFHNLKDYQIAFVEQIANSIASSINNAKIVERTNVLLEDAQQMTAQMHAQEEMMRQNMEELQATQEEIIRGQKASRDREAHLTALINHTDYAASAIDCNFRLLACNMAMQKIYQRYNLSLQPGMQVLDAFESIYGKAEREKRRLIYNRVFAGEKYVDVEEAVVNGQTIHFAVHHTPIRTEDNKIIGLTIYAKNITEEKMKEQEYLRKEEELKKKLESITEENGKLLTEITKLHGNG